MEHSTAVFGLPGFRVLHAEKVGGEWHVGGDASGSGGCAVCGAVARVKDRRTVTVRDLPIADTPVMLRWRKRVFECRYALCEKNTWTEEHDAIAPRAVLTERARQWAFEQVGFHDRAVARVAAQLGVAWHTIMTQVIERGAPLVDDPNRLDGVSAIGVDETSFLRATGTHPTLYATGVADLTPGGRRGCWTWSPAGPGGCCAAGWPPGTQAWRAAIVTASLDPFRGYATALAPTYPRRRACSTRSTSSNSA